MLYWANGEYLGLGCAAHSRLGMARLMNDDDLDGYMARVEATGSGQADALELTPTDDAFDTLMLGTRTLDGVALDEFAARHGTGDCWRRCGPSWTSWSRRVWPSRTGRGSG